jgi:cytochrome c oxidase assembly protein subunit 11
VNGLNKHIIKLAVAAIAMFGFGFALVPLYDVFCEITGLNGKTNGQYTYEVKDAAVDTSRTVIVQFVARNNADMNWEFRPMVAQVEVHPGEMTEGAFYARNPSKHQMVAQAVPTITPWKAADYMHKTECFCFTQQVLAAGESVEMPLLFFIDQDLPENVKKLTLSYALFDVTENFSSTQVSMTIDKP